MNIPNSIYSGDSLTWIDDQATDELGNEITSVDWVLNYKIAGVSVVTPTTISSGTGWSTSLTTTNTSGMAAGVYYWQAWATKGSDRVTLGTGTLTVYANIATASGSYDGRSQVKQDLDAVQASMRAMASNGSVAEYSIQGRSLRKMQMTDLILLESKLKSEYAREQKQQKIASGLGNPDNMYVRFKK